MGAYSSLLTGVSESKGIDRFLDLSDVRAKSVDLPNKELVQAEFQLPPVCPLTVAGSTGHGGIRQAVFSASAFSDGALFPK